jgi:hypothetical protein
MSETRAPAPTPRTLPPAAIDPADVQALVPGLSTEDAERCAQLATLMLEAVLWPGPVPEQPLPAPMYQATLAAAARLASSTAASSSSAGAPIVSESIGTYTYRLATPTPADAALTFTDDELELLEPWLGPAQQTAYSVSVWGTPGARPVDWWQRDLDTLEGS